MERCGSCDTWPLEPSLRSIAADRLAMLKANRFTVAIAVERSPRLSKEQQSHETIPLKRRQHRPHCAGHRQAIVQQHPGVHLRSTAADGRLRYARSRIRPPTMAGTRRQRGRHLHCLCGHVQYETTRTVGRPRTPLRAIQPSRRAAVCVIRSSSRHCLCLASRAARFSVAPRWSLVPASGREKGKPWGTLRRCCHVGGQLNVQPETHRPVAWIRCARHHAHWTQRHRAG